MDLDARDQALIGQVLAVLADGPFPLEELAEMLAEGGYLDHWEGDDFADLADQLDHLFDRYEGIWTTATDLVVLSETLLIGTVFTHRLTAADIARGMIDVHPDLGALGPDAEDVLPLVGGGVLDIAFAESDAGASEFGSYIGPNGWLTGLAAGDVLSLRRTDEGVQLAVTEMPGNGSLEVELLRKAFDARVPNHEVGDVAFALVYDAIAEDPMAFAEPVRPLGELLTDAGVDARGEWIGAAGVDWMPPAIANAEAERVLLAERYQLDVCCLEAFDEAMVAWNELTLPSGERVDWSQVAALLDHGYVAPAFADHVLRELDERHPVLDEFVDVLRSEGGSRAAAPAMYLAARNLERSGDTLAAETALQAALRADQAFDPAIEELAWYTADRGDAEQAISLLRRSGIPSDDPELQLLESMRPPRNAAGRNDPCPCGSGKKYKDCCQRAGRIPIARRGDWLLHKLWTFTLRPHHQRHVLALALMLGDEDDETIDELLDVGLPMDLAAFDDDLARAFLVERGPLLPEDEREVLASWIQQPRALWEVVEHDPGRTLALRDVGGVIVVIALPPTGEFEPGALLYARVGALADRQRFVGVPIEIERDHRSSVEALIATNPNAWDIARWFAAESYAIG